MSDRWQPGEGEFKPEDFYQASLIHSPHGSPEWVAWTKRWKKAAEEKEARRKATLAKRAIQYDATFLEQCGIEHD